jgi:hypothetical protein
VVKLIALLIAAVVAVIVFKTFSHAVVSDAIVRPWVNMLRGFIVLVVVPIVAIILFATIFGALLGALVALAYALLMVVAGLYSGIIFGSWLYRLVKKGEVVITWQWAAIGVIVLGILKLVPLVGWVICFLFFLLAIGAIADMLYQKLWLKR